MYDPTIGRWISQDPLGFAAGDPNAYRYVGNDPTGATDPTGLAKVLGVQFYPPGAAITPTAPKLDSDFQPGQNPFQVAGIANANLLRKSLPQLVELDGNTPFPPKAFTEFRLYQAKNKTSGFLGTMFAIRIEVSETAADGGPALVSLEEESWDSRWRPRFGLNPAAWVLDKHNERRTKLFKVRPLDLGNNPRNEIANLVIADCNKVRTIVFVDPAFVLYTPADQIVQKEVRARMTISDSTNSHPYTIDYRFTLGIGETNRRAFFTISRPPDTRGNR